MKKKIIVDIILTFLLIFIMQYNFTGNLIHEIISIVFLIIFIVHLTFNKKIIKVFYNNNLKGKIKYNVILDILLIIIFIVTIVSGILISNSLFVFFNFDFPIQNNIHYIFSYIFVLLLFIHSLLHINEFTIYTLSILKINNRVVKYIIVFLIFIIFLFNIKSLFKMNNNENNKKDDNSIYEYEDDNDTNDSKIDSGDDSSEAPMTLEEYLSTQHCKGCYNRCALNATRCGRGNQYIEEATNTYYEEYQTSINYKLNESIALNNSDYSVEI